MPPDAPEAVLGRLVVDLRMRGRDVRLFKGMVQDPMHTPHHAVVVVERDAAGRVVFVGAGASPFREEAVDLALARLQRWHARSTGTPRPGG